MSHTFRYRVTRSQNGRLIMYCGHSCAIESHKELMRLRCPMKGAAMRIGYYGGPWRQVLHRCKRRTCRWRRPVLRRKSASTTPCLRVRAPTMARLACKSRACHKPRPPQRQDRSSRFGMVEPSHRRFLSIPIWHRRGLAPGIRHPP